MPLLWPVPTNQPPMKDLCNVIALANIKCIYVTVTMCTRQGTMLSMTTCFAWVEALIIGTIHTSVQFRPALQMFRFGMATVSWAPSPPFLKIQEVCLFLARAKRESNVYLDRGKQDQMLGPVLYWPSLVSSPSPPPPTLPWLSHRSDSAWASLNRRALGQGPQRFPGCHTAG